jgi:phosphoglycolate phosphatase-like HAD superfamily hydrolase
VSAILDGVPDRLASPPADVRDIVAGTRCLLLDFDGPICDVFAGLPASLAASRLIELAGNLQARMPADVADSGDPLRVFTWVCVADSELAARVEAELTELECAAVASATPTPCAPEVITAARGSGRVVAVVSNNSEQAIRSYLAAHGLSDGVDAIASRTSPDAALLKPSPYLVGTALAALGAAPAEASLVGDLSTDVRAARRAGVRPIGYARKPGERATLRQAGAQAVISDLADLAAALLETR